MICHQLLIFPKKTIFKKDLGIILSFKEVNTFCPDPGRREKINVNSYFHTCLWCLKMAGRIKLKQVATKVQFKRKYS